MSSNKFKIKLKGSVRSTNTQPSIDTQPIPSSLDGDTPVEQEQYEHTQSNKDRTITDNTTVKRETITIDDDEKSNGSIPQANTTSTSNNNNNTKPIDEKTPFVFTSKSKKRPSSVLDYLIQLGSDVLNSLYSDLFTALTIFRSLSPLAKQYVIRMLCIDIAISSNIIQSWCKSDPHVQQSHRLAMYRLRELYILYEVNNDITNNVIIKNGSNDTNKKLPNNKQYKLNNNFQQCIRTALFTNITDPTLQSIDTSNNNNTNASNTDNKRLSVDQLTIYANNKWESMLHFMVGATAGNTIISDDIQQRLCDMGLMELQVTTTGTGKNYKKTEQYVITSVGFNFLFKDQATQVWDIILAYIDNIALNSTNNNQNNKYHILQFLFRLSFLRVGYKYDTSTLSDIQHKLLIDLSSFGLVYMKSSTSRTYSPTPLALTLSNTPNIHTPSQLHQNNIQHSGFIIVETTFKVYAFTTSPFHIKLLSLFIRLDYKLPNMIVGTITKQSIRNALKNNITSTEIVNYLDAYAHPQMRLQLPVLPPTVIDQIRLWEHERDRLTRVVAVLFDEFDISTNEFQQTIGEVKKYDPKHILLINDKSKLLVLTPAGLDIVKAWRQAQKRNNNT